MSYLSEHIIPGTKGKTFALGNDHLNSYERMLGMLSRIKGINSIQLNDKVYPPEITVCTDCPVTVKELQESVRFLGFHVIPKSFLFSA